MKSFPYVHRLTGEVRNFPYSHEEGLPVGSPDDAEGNPLWTPFKRISCGVKSIEPEDFTEIRFEVAQLDWICKELRKHIPGVRIDSTDTIGHPMRMWEWGRVLKTVKDHFGYPFYHGDAERIKVLDLGSAVSLIGPALCYLGLDVYETDSDAGWREPRGMIKRFFDSTTVPHAGKFDWLNIGFGGYREQVPAQTGIGQFDIVMSISTIEHVETSLEQQAWLEMFDMLKPGGLMIVTMDCFERAVKGYKYDDVRYTNYDMGEIYKRVWELKSYGMQVLGSEDYDWHGVHVDDGSFAWISMVKPAVLGSGVHISEIGKWPEEETEICVHENLDMDGICKKCGEDCRGTHAPTKIKTAKKKRSRR